MAILPSLVVLILLEGALRVMGYPHGTFLTLFPAATGMYPQNATMHMTWGSVPYTVKSNSLGLRGDEVPFKKRPGSLRIITIGDSITDGFFVDNDATWQHYLQNMLDRGLTRHVEVINCARGGGSIDKELYYLRRFGLPLKPDIVILTFVPNDISDIMGEPVSALLNYHDREAEGSWMRALRRVLLTQTALGEAAFDTYLRIRSPAYRHGKQRQADSFTEARYDIEGGRNYRHNAEEFLRRFAGADGLVLGESFSQETEEALRSYKALLNEVAAVCAQNDARLLFVYFPAYSQVYLKDSSLLINGTLRAMCKEMGISFLDLTSGFREAGRNQILHLAPLDYHLNPRGNRVFAELLAEEVLSLTDSNTKEHTPRAHY
ncbi:MAG TPA: SGNH/GDSL hydrolase family protein [Syntrophorhabdales bacterium]|nr:SGNH/GDSL hydrolase family protein [Syntrophorhabdales bacterium]